MNRAREKNRSQRFSMARFPGSYTPDDLPRLEQELHSKLQLPGGSGAMAARQSS